MSTLTNSFRRQEKSVRGSTSSNQTNPQLLLKEARVGNLNLIKELINEGIAIDSLDGSGYNALMWAVFYNREDCVTFLLQSGSNVNHRCTGGFTPVHIASRLGHVSILRLLLAEGGLFNIPSMTGNLPLHEACSNGNILCVEILLKSGAEVNVKNSLGRYPLHFAVMSKKIEVISMLLDCGATVSVVDNAGFSLLHHASVIANSESVISFLLKRGAKLDVVDMEGYTPIQRSTSLSLWSNVQTLKDYIPPLNIVNSTNTNSNNHNINTNFYSNNNNNNNNHHHTYTHSYNNNHHHTEGEGSQSNHLMKTLHLRITDLEVQLQRNFQITSEMENRVRDRNSTIQGLQDQISSRDQQLLAKDQQIAHLQLLLAHYQGENLGNLSLTALSEIEQRLHKSLVSISTAKVGVMQNEAIHEKKEREKMKAVMLAMEEERLCKVCMENPQNVLLLPCSHLCLCQDCILAILDGIDRGCPICRKPIEGHKLCYLT